MELKGIVESVIFRNAENGYTVLDLDVSGSLVTAVGIFPPVSEGEQLLLTGEMKFNSRFGEQFATESVKISPPTGAESIFKYLSSGLFKGIGEATAMAIVTKFGDKALEVMDDAPHLLSQVRGISMKRAIEIGEAYQSNRERQDTIIYLQQFDMTINMAIKIYKQYQKQTVYILNHNPYKLVEDVDGIGFLTADKLAIRMGVESDSPFRIKAAIIHTLKDNAGVRGNTCLPVRDLIRETLALLSFGGDREDDVSGVIKEMLVFHDLYTVRDEDNEYIMLSLYYNMERSIARHIVSLLKNVHPDETFLDASEEIADFEKTAGIQLHEQQKLAINQALACGCMVITGGPGTGKTTIIKCILHIMQQRQLTYALCAPTGRAAKRMSEATGAEAKTIHRMLDLNFTGNEAAFTYNENTRLPADIVIVDEVSMCDEFVFNALIKAVEKGSRMILIGDADQLPSVGAGNVLTDIISSGTLPVVRLTHIYRQDADSLIITNAHRINNGQMPLFDNTKKDFFFIPKTDPMEIAQTVKELVTKRLPSYYGVKPEDVQVMTPMKKGIVGVINLNRELQQAMNAPTGGSVELRSGDDVFRLHDKVMHTQNNYHMIWQRDVVKNGVHVNETGTGVFNGDIGYITRINRGDITLSVTFEDGRVADYGAGDLEQLQLAYAISVHKSQGSEFPVTVLCLIGGNYMIMTRNLLYTAVTRAKQMLVIVGDETTVSKMVRNNFSGICYSMLNKFLIECLEGTADGTPTEAFI